MAVEELEAAGVRRMDREAIDGFLRSQQSGVLGLPGERAPYLIPMSYGYDGTDSLYFSFFLGPESRKEALAATADWARFLVYHADSTFTWQSVLLEGEIEPVPEGNGDQLAQLLGDAWRPALFSADAFSRGVRIYAFRITERSGLRHTGLPPGLRREGDHREHSD
jgi:nitroimidazol reductase NimA-like FMN-containing flavoprotein (pyridoxamine 5'-phosphate oxidase superfamily)